MTRHDPPTPRSTRKAPRGRCPEARGRDRLGLPPDPLLDDLLARAGRAHRSLEADPALVAAVHAEIVRARPQVASRAGVRRVLIAAAAAVAAVALGVWQARAGRDVEGASGPAPSRVTRTDPAAIEGSAEARLLAILRTASALPTPDAATLAAWREALTDPDEDVRRAAHALLSAAGEHPPPIEAPR